MGFIDKIFGGDSVKKPDKERMNRWRGEMERFAVENEALNQEFAAFRGDMQDYSVNNLKNLVDRNMANFEQQFAQSQELYDLAKSDRAYYDKFYKPIEEKVRNDAMNWDSEANKARASSQAQHQVNQAFDAEKRNNRAKLEGYGIEESTTRANALDRDAGIARAMAQAGQGNAARDQRDQQAIGMRTGAQNYGANIANRGLQTAGTAANIAQSASGIGAQTMGAVNQTNQVNSGMYGQQFNQNAGIGAQWGGVSNNYLNEYGANLQAQAQDVNGIQAAWGIGSNIAGNLAGGGYFNSSSEGGAVPTPEQAGVPAVQAHQVPGDRRGTDRTPTALTPGEFVIPEEIVRWKGEEYFHKDVAKAREAQFAARGQGAGAIPQQGQA
jgi:hypothetical protein